jgi:hypothetical protein
MAISRGPHLQIPGLIATGSLASSQYKLVKLGSTAGTVKVGAAATDAIVGVLYNDPASGEAAQIAGPGVVAVLAEASVSAGTAVVCSTTGRVKGGAKTANDTVVGYALEASSSAGDLISIIFGLSNH